MSLYIVSTPIGNRKDLSQRAKETLSAVDLIACEDTRKTGNLLKFISPLSDWPPLTSFYEENEEKKAPYLLSQLKEGKDIALVSNAGTPLVADPGYKLVRQCFKIGIDVEVIPGPSALVMALVLSGLPPDKFLFLGFLPKKEGKKRKIFTAAEDLAATPLSPTFIFYESPFRLVKTLKLMENIFGGDIQIVIARELTKIHEEVVRGLLKDVLQKLADRKIKGELTVLFSLR